MKEKFEDHINEIAEFPEHIKKNCLGTADLVQEEKIKSLTKHLREQLEQLDFELFIKIMGDKEYDTQIYYYGYYKTENRNLAERKRHEVPIPELKDFFESPECTNEEKKAVEKIIIFGIFLRATYNFYTYLTSYFEKPPNKCDINKTDKAVSEIFFEYFGLLDNLSYKCNPTVYKLLSSLNYIGLWLALSSLIIVPLAILLMFSPPLLAGILITSLILVFFAPLALTSICSIFGSTADERWGTNWAYPLPYNVIEYIPKMWGMNPYEIGIFPSLFGRPAISAGSSFKMMNRLGFFPLKKEITSEAIEIAESVLETNTGKTSVDLPNRF